ncbi:MAG: quinone-dependent dihydroorotate dehydrogenase [Succinivibrio sp.]|nr:quinone-dependent dihydroorotate dehydrogenase [Succinivibrio sp.]
MLYNLYPLLRPLLFAQDAEQAHEEVLKLAARASRYPKMLELLAQKAPPRPCEVMGLKFQNPLGLAAGLDKNAEAVDYFGALGFGFIEVGTVTPRPQEGNPRPRLFRLPQAQALINRMGFNNKGVEYVAARLKERSYRGVLGVSIGKNEDTKLEEAASDYLSCMDAVYPYADYIAVNISCPNTPELTQLQEERRSLQLLKTLKERQGTLAARYEKYVPLVVKIAPDLTEEQLNALLDNCLEVKIDGLNCTNTTQSRELVHGLTHAAERGGLSGQPLRSLSNRILKTAAERCAGRLALIGCGGVDSATAAREKLHSGAQLIQLYTALIYQGPQLVLDILKSLS